MVELIIILMTNWQTYTPLHFEQLIMLRIINFLYSIPQLFKLVPCPRHRLPLFNPETGLQTYSRFPCSKTEYLWLKIHADDEYCPNMTLLNAILRITGPLHERSLCIITLSFQILCSGVAFYLRYVLFED
jgi:UDP-N-acetylglucosamine--dolichyl-phosphate N-acetylglucosaminephosphotransferase